MMKSDIDALRSRGYMEADDMDTYKQWSKIKLFELLHDKEPVKRSIAVRLLSQSFGVENTEISKLLLEQLCMEQKLYTRLEICAALERGNEKTAEQMLLYIGKIGNNQYKTLPERPSLKKSYPLPRDIIARSLGRMDQRVMPRLLEALDTGGSMQLPEILDAIGYLAFYNEAAATKSNMSTVIKTMKDNWDSPLIVWKGILCLSGFPFEESIAFLQDIVKQNRNELFTAEAKRALKLMRKPKLPMN